MNVAEASKPIANDLGIDPAAAERIVALIEAGQSPPFIARYRREETGGLDERAIVALRDRIRRVQDLESREATVLRSLEGQGKLTDELRTQIERADTVARMDDLYLPHKPRQQSAATTAREQGFEPLAEEILSEAPQASDLDARAADFVNEDKQVTDAPMALAGAGQILSEHFSHHADLRRRVRSIVRKTGKLVCKRAEGASDKKAESYKAFLDYREPLSKAPPHRVLAINRGERAKVLTVGVEADVDAAVKVAKELLAPPTHTHVEFLAGCAAEAVRSHILPALEKEARDELTERAEAHAMEVFARNLRNLLLGPTLPGKRVLAIDPGYQNGCHLAAIDESGAVLATGTVSIVSKKKPAKKKAKEAAEPTGEPPSSVEAQTTVANQTAVADALAATPVAAGETQREPENETDTAAAPVTADADETPVADAAQVADVPAEQPAPAEDPVANARRDIVAIVTQHSPHLIAIGNGKACRPVEELVASLLAEELKDRDLEYLVVSEAGANVYASSTVGREELPDLEAAARSAVSIGRRVQDPLAELVKVDPASVGVGLYQHDAKSKPMRDALEEVVRSCVAHVGVNLNTAAASLLQYVPGLNPLTARRICEHREKEGPLASRKQLLEITGLNEAAYTQSAGFLKIDSSDQPLDATWVHPDDYSHAEKLLTLAGVDSKSAITAEAAEKFTAAIADRDTDALATELGIGAAKLEFLINALSNPGSDPRDELPPPAFRRGVVRFEDLAPGAELQGVVLNVVDFGAFVDIGLSDSGLLHISRMSHDFVSDPHALVSVGDRVQVWVDAVDAKKRRVSLSMIQPGTERPKPTRHRRGGKPKAADTGKNASARGDDAGQATPRKRPKRGKPRHGDKKRQGKPARSHGYQTRSKAPPKPITKEMVEGKEAMRTFGDLLQFHKQKSSDQADDDASA
ncbi:MAG: Tex-like N-terminal domain-containing protein [Planctomycetota bacterium]